ncbi:hypothetical protein L6452_01156 [Arctium lappa]|uniref:Uncharacterized protein n=1 Tax=Arctium lappa TaxID=4217 RepID=A0ACB9FH58_ARCLA|nr:hypothetical protein L6452_01156 [Arctium lappa]
MDPSLILHHPVSRSCFYGDGDGDGDGSPVDGHGDSKETTPIIADEGVQMEMEKLGGKSMAVATETTTISGKDQKVVPNSKSILWRLDSCSSFGSDGSMRNMELKQNFHANCSKQYITQKEQAGEEGMDSLWEAYENDHSTTITKLKNTKIDAMVKQKKTLIKNKNEFKFFISNGQLCCLKALMKMSSWGEIAYRQKFSLIS